MLQKNDPTDITGWFARYGVTFRLAAVFSAILVTVILVLSHVYRQEWKNAAYRGLQEKIGTAIHFATNPLRPPEVRELEYIGRRLVTRNIVLGGYIVDESDRIVGRFGDNLPDAAMVSAITRDGYTRTADNRYIDLRYSGIPERLGHDFVVRLDRAQYSLLASLDNRSQAMVAFVAFVAGLGLFLLAVFFLTIRPLRTLCSAMMEALAQGGDGARLAPQWQRPDEIGDVARSIDVLMRVASAASREENAAFAGFIDDSDLPIFTLNDENRVGFANRAALEFFGVADIDELTWLGWPLVTRAGDRKHREYFIGSVIDTIKKSCYLTIKTMHGRCQVQAFSTRHLTRANSQSCTVIALFDITRFVQKVSHQRAESELAHSRRRQAEQMLAFKEYQLASLSRHFERQEGGLPAGASPPDAALRSTHIPDRVIQAWHNRARETGVAEGRLEYDLLHPVGVPPHLFEIAIDAIMAFLIAAAGQPGVRFAVHTSELEGNVEYKFAIRRPHRATGGKCQLVRHIEAEMRSAVADCRGVVRAIEDFEMTLVVTVAFPDLAHAEITDPKTATPTAA